MPTPQRRPLQPLAKLTAPLVSSALLRPRLQRRLEALEGSPLWWLCGPPGCGKTTLAAHAAGRSDGRRLWMQIDAGDSEPATFFHFLHLAVEALDARAAARLPALSADRAARPLDHGRVFFRRLFEGLRAPALLVFDDWHRVAADSPMHEILAAALDEAPAASRLVVTSRGEPSDAFARALTHGRLAVVGWDDLRLTAAETASLAASQGLVDASRVQALHERCSGWVAGVRLMLQAERDRLPRVDIDEPVVPGVLDAYFDTQILRTLDEPAQRLLLAVSMLPSVTPELAHGLTGDARAGEVLRSLQRRNLFIETRGGSYRCHDLLRSFLSAEFERRTPPAERIELQVRAARALEAARRPEEALPLLRQAGQWADATRSTLALAANWLRQGRTAALLDALDQLEGHVDDPTASAWAAHWRGMACLHGNPRAARTELVDAHAGFVGQGDMAGRLRSAIGIVLTHQVEFADLTQLDRWLDELGPLLDGLPGSMDPSAELQARAALLWACTYRRPARSVIDPQRDRCLEIVEVMAGDPSCIVPATLLLQFLFQAADVGRAQHLVNLVHATVDRDGVPAAPRCFWLQCVGFHLAFAGHREPALDCFDRVLALARTEELRLPALTVLCRIGQSVCAIERGDVQQAADACEAAAAESMPTRSLEQSLIAMQRCRVAMHHRDGPAAMRHARTWCEHAARIGAVFHLFQGRIALARALVDQDRLDEADDLIAQAGALVAGTAFERHACQVDFARALASRRRGEAERAREHLANALARASAVDYPHLLRFNPGLLEPLLAEALAGGIETAYVRQLIRRFDLKVPGGTPAQHAAPLAVRCFGAFELARNGEIMRFAGKAPKKPLQLLQALIAMGGDDVAETRLADALWPDAEGTQARDALKTTLARLRRLLQDPQAIRQSGGRLRIDAGRCWVDALAFEGSDPQAAPLVLYRGPFLIGEDAPWATHARERLQVRFLRVLADTAQSAEAVGRWADAADLYDRAVQTDPLAEAWTEALMRCQLALGRSAEAGAALERLRRGLRRVRGTVPSARLEALLQGRSGPSVPDPLPAAP